MSVLGDGRPGLAEQLRRRRTALGSVSLPRDSLETLALLLSRGLLCAERDDHANGHPLVYRPTPRSLPLLRVETMEEAQVRMGGSADQPGSKQ
jgi:hypothetical protein